MNDQCVTFSCIILQQTNNTRVATKEIIIKLCINIHCTLIHTYARGVND